MVIQKLVQHQGFTFKDGLVKKRGSISNPIMIIRTGDMN